MSSSLEFECLLDEIGSDLNAAIITIQLVDYS